MKIRSHIGSGKIRAPWGAVEGFFIGCDIFLMCPTDNMRTRYNIRFINIHPKFIQSSNLIVHLLRIPELKKMGTLFLL